jgi:hypothetical protein
MRLHFWWPKNKCVVQAKAGHFMKYVDNLNEWQDFCIHWGQSLNSMRKKTNLS